MLCPYFDMQYCVCFLVLQSSSLGRERERASCFTFTIFLVSPVCYSYLPRLYGAVCRSTVCDWGVSWSYLLT